MNKLNKLSASHKAALFLLHSLLSLAEVISSSKSLEKSYTKISPFNSFFLVPKLLRVQVFRFLRATAAPCASLRHLSELHILNN